MVHRPTIHSCISSKQVFYVPDLKLGKNWHVVLTNPLRKVFNVPVGDVYQDVEPQLNLNVDLNLDQSSLRRDEEYIVDEETDPSDLESSEKEGSSQEDESSQEDYIDSD
ncbi:hypothetical protein Tco_0841122 [Tanacetum coccineum]|uniref:DUF4216 domain-containing protein n=1 Tax=Tanacetum coccineum TaxID=301880 RepID=A0ABQ5AVS7_9ASTR